MSEFYSKDSINHKVITFAKDGKIIILGGFFDGKVVLVGLDGKGDNQIVPFKDESPVLCIIADKDNEYIFMGNALGNVCIYKNIEGKYKNEFLLTDQQNAISHMFYSPELNLLATASIDGYICIYTLPLCKLIRCLKVPNNSCKYVILSDAPLPVIIVICEGKDENDEIYVYSINGNLFLQKEEYFKISNPILVKNINSNDYLACIGDDNIYILSVPDLIIQVAVEKEFEAHSMCFSEDNKLLYLLNKQGTEVMVIKTEKEKNKLSRSVTVLKK
jgi:WD40 repeat protein